MHRSLFVVPLALLAASAAVQAQEGDAPPTVEARHGIMDNYSFNLSTLGDMAKGEAEYDADLAKAAADRLVVLSDIPWTGYWPEGTAHSDVEASRALPAIWTQMDDFLAGFDDLHQAALSMQSVAGDGQEAIAGEMRALGQACGGCHEDYRMSDD